MDLIEEIIKANKEHRAEWKRLEEKAMEEIPELAALRKKARKPMDQAMKEVAEMMDRREAELKARKEPVSENPK